VTSLFAPMRMCLLEMSADDPEVIRIAPVLHDHSATGGAGCFAASHGCEDPSGRFGLPERR
jgi:hypothetical protein